MSRHIVDIYVDGSIAENDTAGTGVYLEFNQTDKFKLGAKEDKKTTHIEAVELRAVERVLARLNGGSKTRKISNSVITFYIDNQSVINFLEKGHGIKSLDPSSKTNCIKLLESIRDTKFNNKIHIKKIDHGENKAHTLAYNAAVKGQNIKEGAMPQIIEKSLKKPAESKSVTPESRLNIIENSQGTVKDAISTVIGYISDTSSKIEFLEAKVSEQEILINTLNKSLEEKSNSVNKYNNMLKNLSDEVVDKYNQIRILNNTVNDLRTSLDNLNKHHLDIINDLNNQLDLYKKKAYRLEKQRKIRNLREKLNRSLEGIQDDKIPEDEILSQVAITTDISFYNDKPIVIEKSKSKGVIPGVIKKLIG